MGNHTVGVVIDGLNIPDDRPLRYALLHLNTLQDIFDIDIVYDFNHSFFEKYGSGTVDRQDCEVDVAEQLSMTNRRYELEARDRERRQFPLDILIVFTSAVFSDNYYISNGKGGTYVVALGNWKRTMAPPSLLEFMISITIKMSIGHIQPAMQTHLNSHGCMFDFNMNIANARYHVLTGHICDQCAQLLESERPGTMRQVNAIAGSRWLGDPSDMQSAHATLTRLGFRPFRSSGAAMTWRDRLADLFPRTLLEETVKLLAAVLLAWILLQVGLSNG